MDTRCRVSERERETKRLPHTRTRRVPPRPSLWDRWDPWADRRAQLLPLYRWPLPAPQPPCHWQRGQLQPVQRPWQLAPLLLLLGLVRQPFSAKEQTKTISKSIKIAKKNNKRRNTDSTTHELGQRQTRNVNRLTINSFRFDSIRSLDARVQCNFVCQRNRKCNHL